MWRWRLAVKISIVLAAVRIFDCWLLFVLDRTGQASISQLPLVILPYPEASLVQPTGTWDVPHYLLLSVLLALGSAVVGIVSAGIIIAGRRLMNRERHELARAGVCFTNSWRHFTSCRRRFVKLKVRFTIISRRIGLASRRRKQNTREWSGDHPNQFCSFCASSWRISLLSAAQR
jgi:hypothetical protein